MLIYFNASHPTQGKSQNLYKALRNTVPVSSLTLSSTPLPSSYSVAATVAPVISGQTKNTATSRPLHLQPPLPWMLFSQILTWCPLLLPGPYLLRPSPPFPSDPVSLPLIYFSPSLFSPSNILCIVLICFVTCPPHYKTSSVDLGTSVLLIAVSSHA